MGRGSPAMASNSGVILKRYTRCIAECPRSPHPQYDGTTPVSPYEANVPKHPRFCSKLCARQPARGRGPCQYLRRWSLG